MSIGFPPNIPPEFLSNVAFDILRPYHVGSDPITSGAIGTLIADFPCGRSPGGGNLQWTHRLFVNPGTDIRDGVTRIAGGNGTLYVDGDGVKILTHFGIMYFAVVFVEFTPIGGDLPGDAKGVKTVYLLRDHNVYV